jgi:Rrf2 family iron-sulfur cluster assembly transcriptional regulator
MLSRTGTYALQATLHLAGCTRGEAVAATVIASRLDVPATYLAKVLHRLSREGVLHSSRGAHGGYHLARRAEEVTVAEVIAPFEDIGPSPVCLLGGLCDPDDPCPAHELRVAWWAASRRMLEATTLADLIAGTPISSLPHDFESKELAS